MSKSASEQRHESFVDIEGSVNLRDFGGYQTTDGRTIRRGQLFRCGTMAEIPEHAFDDFAGLDIGVICDLRGHDEVENSPTPDAEPFQCRIHIPIWPGSSMQFQESARERQMTHEDFIEFMHQVTREIARDHVEAYKQLMRELVNTERGFLLHCSAGKDRTGFGAAIILTLLGVERETVVHDYLISNQARELVERTLRRMRENAAERNMPEDIDEEVIRIFAGVREEYLLGAFEEIDRHYGGIHGYLEAVGITRAEEEHLKNRLLLG
ncbi:MAG: tyrosine-protein phosphatase [Proteobacteria bacterium]|nr:tyrosine-protein phosphatase [Pseudomonadota bacterium]